MKILVVIGTRPEAIKMAPIVHVLARTAGVESRVLVTGQHRELVDQVLALFEIVPVYDLDIMQRGQTSADILVRVVAGMQPILQSYQPDWVLVQGDTTTIVAATLAAVYARCRVGHVEAGLRTYDRDNPFPEEINRVVVDHASHLFFAPTESARAALLAEGIAADKIALCGNTVIDALQMIVRRPAPADLWRSPVGKHLLLVTTHRRENHGAPLARILDALEQLAARDDVHLAILVHPNPVVRDVVIGRLANHANVTLLPPQPYAHAVHLMQQAALILTDSGGIQEEAPALGVPVLVLREKTERPEAVVAGAARLVGTNTATIVAAATALLDDAAERTQMTQAVSLYGDGTAAGQIVEFLKRHHRDSQRKA